MKNKSSGIIVFIYLLVIVLPFSLDSPCCLIDETVESRTRTLSPTNHVLFDCLDFAACSKRKHKSLNQTTDRVNKSLSLNALSQHTRIDSYCLHSLENNIFLGLIFEGWTNKTLVVGNQTMGEKKRNTNLKKVSLFGERLNSSSLFPCEDVMNQQTNGNEHKYKMWNFY